MFADFVENDAGIFPVVRESEEDDAEILWEGGHPLSSVDAALATARFWISTHQSED